MDQDHLTTQKQVEDIRAFTGQDGYTDPTNYDCGTETEIISPITGEPVDGTSLQTAITKVHDTRQRRITFNSGTRVVSYLRVEAALQPNGSPYSPARTRFVSGPVVGINDVETDFGGQVSYCGEYTPDLSDGTGDQVASQIEVAVTSGAALGGFRTVLGSTLYTVDVLGEYTGDGVGTGTIMFTSAVRNPAVIEIGDGLRLIQTDTPGTIRIEASPENQNIVITNDTDILFYVDGSGSMLEELYTVEYVVKTSDAGYLKAALTEFYGSGANYDAHVKFIRTGRGNPANPLTNPDALTEDVFAWLQGKSAIVPNQGANDNTPESSGDPLTIQTRPLPRKVIIMALCNEVYNGYVSDATNQVHVRAMTDIDNLKTLINPCNGNFDYYRACIMQVQFYRGAVDLTPAYYDLQWRNFLMSCQLGDLAEFSQYPNNLLSYRYNVRRVKDDEDPEGGPLINTGGPNSTIGPRYYFNVIGKALKAMGVPITVPALTTTGIPQN